MSGGRQLTSSSLDPKYTTSICSTSGIAPSGKIKKRFFSLWGSHVRTTTTNGGSAAIKMMSRQCVFGPTSGGVCRRPLGYQTARGCLTSWIFIQELRGILEKQNESIKEATLLLLYVGTKFQHILFAGHFKLVGEPKILHLHLKTTMKEKVRSSEARPHQQCWVTLCWYSLQKPASGLCMTCPCLSPQAP